MSDYIVETVGLTKRFKHQTAVNDMNMKVEKGAIYGFIGKNGAGKTTTLKMLCGLCNPTSGEIHLFHDTHKEFTYRNIGALIENAGVYPELTAKENMLLKSTGLGIHKSCEVDELLALLHLKEAKAKKVKHFSLGMKQRLGIALALLGNPDLLILDEPTNGLDPEGIREMRNILFDLNKRKGTTILISSHILNELNKIATHYGVIKNGELIEQFTQSELSEKCKNYLSLSVDNIEKTILVLEEKLKITNYELMENGEIHLYGEIESGMISSLLASYHIHVMQLYYQKQDLETYFINLIGGY